MLAARTNRDVNQKKINAALIGDPGLVKSTLLRRTVRLVPNSKYESAQNSSGKSLTAIVVPVLIGILTKQHRHSFKSMSSVKGGCNATAYPSGATNFIFYVIRTI